MKKELIFPRKLLILLKMGKDVEKERMFLTVLNRKIWLSSLCDYLLLTLTIQQADSELNDSLVLISSERRAPKAVAYVANLAHHLKQFPGV